MRETIKSGTSFKYVLFAISLIIAAYIYAYSTGWDAAPSDDTKHELPEVLN